MDPHYFYPYYPNYQLIQPYDNSYLNCSPNRYRHYPDVNPGMFMNSAKGMEMLMKDASHLLAEMARSRKFSFDLMSAAQQSKADTVEKLIKSTGIKTIPKVTYTPDGLKLHFNSGQEYTNCCELALKLRWT